jgi:hypothetical protein
MARERRLVEYNYSDPPYVPANNGPRTPKENRRIPNWDRWFSLETQGSALKVVTSGVYRIWGSNRDRIDA